MKNSLTVSDTWLRRLVTIAALGGAAVHLAWPALSIDGITVTLLLVAVVPWLRPLFKSLELPGGVKVEFQELKEVASRAADAGLLPVAPQTQLPPKYSFQLVAESDPNLALAGLRIELERRLLQLAESRGAKVQRTGLEGLLRELNSLQLINGTERSVLSDLAALLNSAVHGAQVEPSAADWALDVGPRILAALEERASSSAFQYKGVAE